METQRIDNGKKRDRDKEGKFVEGNPGGPGRPEGSVSIVGRAKQLLKEDPTRLNEIAENLLRDKKLRVELIRQIDGMPKQSHEIEGEIKTKLELNDNQFEQLVRIRAKGLDREESGEGEID